MNRLPLISGNDNEHDNQSHRADTGIQQSKLLTPGLDGAMKGRLKDVRFVATGYFPELGGGEGLKLGRDNLKLMIESFGGKVTGSISGKTKGSVCYRSLHTSQDLNGRRRIAIDRY